MKSAEDIIGDMCEAEVRDFAIAALVELQQVHVTTCEDIVELLPVN